MFRGPRLGCLIPSAAPSIRLPGSPIRGAPAELLLVVLCSLVAKIAGSFRIASSPNDEDDEIIELNVGLDGTEGNVGDGSRPPPDIPFVEIAATTGCSGMVPFKGFICPFRILELAIRACPLGSDIDADRPLCVRDALLMCRELTFWMID